MKKILFAEPTINSSEVLNYTKKALKQNFPNEGKFTRIFENKIKKILKIKYVVSTTSGTSAIFLALKTLNLKKNDEVIIPNITFPATANAVKMSGAKLILADINPNNLLMDLDSLKKLINKNTKVVIPVHVSGRGENIKEIIKICKSKNIKIIEDAAEAFGSQMDKKHLGTYGDLGCFSFAPNKIITTGQGGVVVTNNKLTFKKLSSIKDQGRVGPTTGGEDIYVTTGFNLKFTNLQSALGISQLKTFYKRKQKLLKIHRFYRKNLVTNNNFKLFKFNEKNGELPLWSDVYCKQRNKLFNYLKKNNINCRYFWYPLNNCKPFKKPDFQFKNTNKLRGKLMWLPSSINLKFTEQKKICKLINSFYKK